MLRSLAPAPFSWICSYRGVNIKTLVYEDCEDGLSFINGQLTLSREYIEGESTPTLFFGSDDLTLSQGFAVVTVSGAERWRRSPFGVCAVDDGRTSTLLVREMSSGREILLDGVQSNAAVDDPLTSN